MICSEILIQKVNFGNVLMMKIKSKFTMAKTITLYKIFLASPSDLYDERILVEEVVEELNFSTFNNSNIKIELVRWETHANPDIGKYPQQVINNDIGSDYDIFIGLLWSKFGQPTENYSSGTEEEFYNAYSRYKRNSSSIKIMFYFKQAPIPFEKIDTDGINLIRKFKSGLGEKGILYWEYTSIDEFQKLIRIQLTRKIQELLQIENTFPILVENRVDVIEDEDLGLLDYMEIGEECFSDIEEILGRMTSAIEWLGKRFTERTNEIDMHKLVNPQMGNKTKKRLINTAADDMISFNKRLSVEIPLFSETYRKGIDSFFNAIKIGITLKADKEEDIENSINSIDVFIEAILYSNQNCGIFRNLLIEFPRMTKEYNQAKRICVSILDNLINEFEIAINLAKALQVEFYEYRTMY